MLMVLKNLFHRYFRVYFALAILAFLFLILLMNLPELSANEPKVEALTPVDRALQNEPEESQACILPDKFYRWPISTPQTEKNSSESFMEFHGKRMYLKVKF